MIASLSQGLQNLAINVWSSMADTALALCQDDPATQSVELEVPRAHVVSSVQIVGQWSGAVSLDMDMALARATTAKLLGADESEVSREEVRDASGELANMVGGGFKEMLPSGCMLALPTVVMGQQFISVNPGGRVALKFALATSIGRVHVLVIEKENRFKSLA